GHARRHLRAGTLRARSRHGRSGRREVHHPSRAHVAQAARRSRAGVRPGGPRRGCPRARGALHRIPRSTDAVSARSRPALLGAGACERTRSRPCLVLTHGFVGADVGDRRRVPRGEHRGCRLRSRSPLSLVARDSRNLSRGASSDLFRRGRSAVVEGSVMARLESVAVGGYYPTPEKVVPLIARLLDAGPSASYLDPCAGDGAALLALMRAVHGDDLRHTSVYAVELEKTRHEALKKNVRDLADWRSSENALHGDAFKADFRGDGVSLLYLNPPYDLDPEHGRLEEKFLARFVDVLAANGVLVFLVPFYALKASATTLATHFTSLSCFRFPADEFAAYKQVALFATKRETPLWDPDPAIVNDVVKWAADADTLAALDAVDLTAIETVSYSLPSGTPHSYALSEWKIRPLDMKALLAATSPWMQTERGGKRAPVPGIVPEGTLDDLLVRRYPLAMPPRSAHIAAGIAAGIFNGARLAPDDPSSPLPEILVKGVFDKEFRTVDEKRDKEGNVKALVQVQQPKLVTTVLDPSTSRYVTVKPEIEPTSATRVDDMTMADLLRIYGRGLMNVMLRQCPVLHDASRAEDEIALPELARPLFHAQKHATMAAVKLLRAKSRSAAYVLGEIGSGKTSVALAAARAVDSKRALVMC